MRRKIIFVAYVDDGIFLGPHKHLIDEAICNLLHVGSTENIKRMGGSILLSQLLLIQSIPKCVRFSTCPKKEHGDVVEYIARYLKITSESDMLFHPKMNEAFNVDADADFADNWLKEYADFDPATVKSR